MGFISRFHFLSFPSHFISHPVFGILLKKLIRIVIAAQRYSDSSYFSPYFPYDVCQVNELRINSSIISTEVICRNVLMRYSGSEEFASLDDDDGLPLAVLEPSCVVVPLVVLPFWPRELGASVCNRLTNSMMPATLLFISFMLVRVGLTCLARDGRPLSPLTVCPP